MTLQLPNIVGRARDRYGYNTQDGIRAVDFGELAKVLHWLFQRAGDRVDSYVFDPAWENTSSSTFSQASDSASKGLGELKPKVTPDRLVDDAGTDVYAVQLQIYGEDVDINHEIRTAGGSVISSATFTGTSTGYYRDWLLWDPSATSSAEGVLEHWMEAKADSTTARIWQAQIDELVIPDATWIPTTLF
ncbi:MAG: hypothetical protein ABEN55_21750 [Bradymonadaceae bacterium]